jgi:hypothetical protein
LSGTIDHKLSLSARLLADIFRQLFPRLLRWAAHWLKLPAYLKNSRLYGVNLHPAGRLLLWTGEGVFLLLDIIGLPEGYEIANCWFKGRIRTLTEHEKALARSVFGSTLPLDRIQLDERAYIGPKQYRFCYVSFCLINSWEAMPPAVLVHELVHVWQFQRVGSPYILRALLAQRTSMGYDYGGTRALIQARERGMGLQAFNYEQQAAIIEDFFLLQQGGFARWVANGRKPHLTVYRYFVDSLRTASKD